MRENSGGDQRTSIFAKHTVYNITLQILLRGTTFLVNIFLLHKTSLAVLGVVNVRLMLLYSTVSFFARESFRRSCLGSGVHLSGPAVMNVIWLCPLVAAIFSAICSFVWLVALVNPEQTAPVTHYATAVWLYATAVVVEAFAEPLWVFFQNMEHFKLKVVIECLQNAVRNLVTLVLVSCYPHWSLLSFAYSMIISSVIYVAMYYGYFVLVAARVQSTITFGHRSARLSLSSVLPMPSVGLDKHRLCLVFSFLKHGLLKQLLTEGERYVMAFFNLLDFTDQGVMDAVTNLGSLVARMLLAPLEESCYTYFSQNIERGKSAINQDRDRYKHVHRTLISLMKLVCTIGLTVVVFGQGYSYVVLKLYAGDALCKTSGPLLLRLFCFYILLLAVNGLTECFMMAAMKCDQVDRHGRTLAYFCLIFLLSSVLLCRLYGSVGFILANYVNMICRIIYSCRFIASFYKDAEPKMCCPLMVGFMPRSSVVIVLLVSLLMICLSNAIFCCNGFFNTFTHLIIGCLLFIGSLLTVYNSEPELAGFVRRFICSVKAEKSA